MNRKNGWRHDPRLPPASRSGIFQPQSNDPERNVTGRELLSLAGLALAAFEFAFDGLADEFGAFFVLGEGGLDLLQNALGNVQQHPVSVDAWSTWFTWLRFFLQNTLQISIYFIDRVTNNIIYINPKQHCFATGVKHEYRRK